MRLLFLVLGACLACAAQADSATDSYFHGLDLNGDGYVSLAEAAGDAVVVNRFDRADRNRDGKLSPKEFANLRKVKVRLATRKKHDKGESAAVGGTAPKPASGPQRGAKISAGGG